jgi:peptidyl-prolyl cis-trans isomerase B (cyclophilin B)
MRRLTFIFCVALAAMPLLTTERAHGTAPDREQGTARAPVASPIVVIETAKGTIEVELFRAEAPKSVDHIMTLVTRSFYRSQRVHRVVSTLVQFGDPQSRDMTKQSSWGTGSSFKPIGVAEISKRRHVRGAVGLAHAGNATLADSQIYIMKTASPALDGKHAIIGQVIRGMTVVDKLERTDLIKLVTLKETGQK